MPRGKPQRLVRVPGLGASSSLDSLMRVEGQMDRNQWLMNLAVYYAKEYCNLSRNTIAGSTGVNGGQFSQFLKHNGPLSEDKISAICLFLMEKLNPFSEKDEQLKALLEQFRGLPCIRALEGGKPSNAIEGLPLSAEHPNFLQRRYSRELKNMLHGPASRPIAVVGGPRVGKTTLMYDIERIVEQKGLRSALLDANNLVEYDKNSSVDREWAIMSWILKAAGVDDFVMAVEDFVESLRGGSAADIIFIDNFTKFTLEEQEVVARLFCHIEPQRAYGGRRTRFPQFVCAMDPTEVFFGHFPHIFYPLTAGLSTGELMTLGERYGASSGSVADVIQQYGGHPHLSQLAFAEEKDALSAAQVAYARRASKLVEEVYNRGALREDGAWGISWRDSSLLSSTGFFHDTEVIDFETRKRRGVVQPTTSHLAGLLLGTGLEDRTRHMGTLTFAS